MTRQRRLAALVAATVCLAGAFGLAGMTAGAGGEPEPSATARARQEIAKISKAQTAELAQSCNEFAFDLYREAAKQGKQNANLVVAPYSVAEALGLAYAGARGPTADEIAKTLHLGLKAEQTGPAFASLSVGAGGRLADQAGSAPYRFGVRVRDTDGAGVEITEVRAGSPAAAAKLKPKDRIIRLGDWGIRDLTEYANALDTFVEQLEGEVRDEQGTHTFTARLNVPTAGQTRIRPLLANAFWGRQDVNFLPAFKETAALYYNAAVASLDFQKSPQEARAHINRWIADNTDDEIQNLLPAGAVSPRTALVLTNAVYLQAGWRVLFDPKLTTQTSFLAPGKKQLVSMMNKNAKFRYGEGEDFQVIELGLEGDFAMTFYLPARKEGKDTLSEFEQKRFNAKSVGTWAEQLRLKQVNVSLPRFKIKATADLQGALTDLGMATAFSSDADFTGMASQAKLGLSNVIHQAELQVNEKGVRATASTAALATLIIRAEAHFNANHPFLFTIRDTRQGVLLFIGRVTSPEPVDD